MRLPDPFTDNTAPGFSEARLSDTDPVLVDEMADGSVLKVNVASQVWKLELSYPDLFYEEYAQMMGFLAEAKRTKSKIEVLLPQYEGFRVGGYPENTTIASGQGGSTLTISNSDQLTGRPNLNDLFKITGNSKVYRITSYTDNGDNTITLGLYPTLAKVTTGTEKPIFNTVLFEMTLADNNLPVEDPSTDGMYRGFSFSLREDIS